METSIEIESAARTNPRHELRARFRQVRTFIGYGLVAASVGACAANNAKLSRYEAAEKLATDHLATFDTLDFDVYTNQKWDRLKESHAENITVHYPDGHTTTGIPAHIEELKPLFSFAPDTRIKTHPVRIASGGEWTSVIGVLEGTFTQAMNAQGKAIPPTGKAFKLQMCTVGHWTSANVMDEEYLFWDNALLMKQLGLAP